MATSYREWIDENRRATDLIEALHDRGRDRQGMKSVLYGILRDTHEILGHRDFYELTPEQAHEVELFEARTDQLLARLR